jgi:hypothetical protein
MSDLGPFHAYAVNYDGRHLTGSGPDDLIYTNVDNLHDARDWAARVFADFPAAARVEVHVNEKLPPGHWVVGPHLETVIRESIGDPQ